LGGTSVLEGLSLLVVGALLAGGSGTDEAGPKLLEVGWDAPTPAYAVEHVHRMERRPFDGVVFELAAIRHDGSRFLTKRPTPASAYADDRAALASFSSAKLTDNFIRLNSACDERWDWFDGSDWASARANLRNVAATAGAGERTAGIFFDPEAYGRNCWTYDGQSRAGRKSFGEYERIVRSRGASLMRQLQRVDPAMRVLGTSLISIAKDEPWLDPSSPRSRLREHLRRDDYGLLPAFVDGMVSAAKPGTILADGNESSYYALDSAAYWSGEREVIDRGARKVVRGYDPARYQQFYRHDYAVYADLDLDLFEPGPGCADWCRQWVPHYLSPSDRRRLLQTQIYDALGAADDYVWYYSERQDWWRGRRQGRALPPVSSATQAAVTRALDRFRAGEPLGFDITASFQRARRECRSAGGAHCD
jgi:hypothetical protein